MLKADKERIVTELAAGLSSAETLIVADYRGLTNKQLEALRDELLEHGARFRIVKNTLTRRAAEQAGAEALLVMLEGPTAIAFIESSGDPAAVAKTLATTAKATNVLTLRGGILEGKALSGEEVNQLATLPPLDVLRGQLVGAIVAPLTQLLALVSAPLSDLHGLIDARIEQLGESAVADSPTGQHAAAVPESAEEALREREVAVETQESASTEVEQLAETGGAARGASTATPADSASVESDDQEGPAVSATAESAPRDTEEEEE